MQAVTRSGDRRPGSETILLNRLHDLPDVREVLANLLEALVLAASGKLFSTGQPGRTTGLWARLRGILGGSVDEIGNLGRAVNPGGVRGGISRIQALKKIERRLVPFASAKWNFDEPLAVA